MIIKNVRVFLNGAFRKASFRVTDGRFSEISEGTRELTAAPDEQVLDYTGHKVIPGLFDIHTHGCLGYDFTFSSAEEDVKMLKHYAEHGVTSVLATTMTSAPDTYRRACSQIRRLADPVKDSRGFSARIRGINAEGPFLSLEKKGAHDPQYITAPDEAYFNELNELSGGMIRLITIAPEQENAIEFIKKHTAGNSSNRDSALYVSVGHSDCDYDKAMEAFNAGADHVTHLYNAMNGLHHRKPGIPAASADANAWVELICDGLHVHESVIRHAFKAYPGRVVLISDSIAPSGLPDGQYSSGGLPVFLKDGEIRLEDGTLAGSGITLFEGLKRCVTDFGIPEEEAILAATYNPAASVGLEGRCGSIAVGLDADFVVIDDDYTLRAVHMA
ncbi:MAG: N-acetylglucosamine-6-phosphate deacetylase [Lachnospiraceae bacterium]|nr:N-acetylglucosamine-6-phosphate deacetylase [Lachnospiraceae bacterium]